MNHRHTVFVRMIRLLVMCFVLCAVHGDTKPTDTKSRVHAQEPLSKLEHDDEKNHDYDHEAFLGQDRAKTFDSLPPEESKRRLGIIVDKIDTNNDGFVEEKELQFWINNAHRKHLSANVDRQMEELDTNKDREVSWEEYKTITFEGYLDNPQSDGEFNFTDMMVKDKRRFSAADRNGDLKLNPDELLMFLYPERFQCMHGVLAQETIDEVDKNRDGVIDSEEYIADLYTPEAGEAEPQWVSTERQDFKKKDINKDGVLDRKEVLNWILPDDEDTVETEGKHLLDESDTNKDGKLTKEEILNNYKLFVGSQVTEYGEALQRHDEF